MSLFGALSSGVSGLTAQSSAMGAISDNITNVSTIGYKNTRVNFQTLVTKQTSATFYSAGGVQSKPRQLTDVQGLLQASTSQTDISISGNGQTIPGKHALTWDGMGLDGGQNPDGTYSVTVTAFDRAKNLLDVAQTGFGRVTGASAATGEPTLFLRDIEVPLTGILSIRESTTSVQ